jgi:hypothetical protein
MEHIQPVDTDGKEIIGMTFMTRINEQNPMALEIPDLYILNG